MWNQETSEAIQRGKIPLNATEHRALHALMNNALKGNIINKTQTFLANQTGVKVQQFNRAMSNLHKLGFWARCPDEGSRHVLMLSPYKGWKGNAEWQEAAQDKFDTWRQLEELSNAKPL